MPPGRAGSRVRRPGVVGIASSLVAMVCLSSGLPPTSAPALADQYIARPGEKPPDEFDFAEFLTARDLVFEGTVVSAVTASVTVPGGCGLSGPYQYGRSTILSLRIDQPWHGVAPDSTAEIIVVFPRLADEADAGRRVLAWGRPSCDDNWRLWGNFCWVASDGAVSTPYGEPIWLRGFSPGAPVRLSDVRVTLASRPALRPSVSAFEGAEAVALLRVSSVQYRDSTGVVSYACDSLGWALGRGTATPRLIESFRGPAYYAEIFAGDTVVVPVPRGFAGGTLRLEVCPSAFDVQNGYATGLGVPIGSLDRALDRSVDGLRPRDFVRP